MTTFKDLGLSDSTLEALAHLGYASPTPIQEQAIPPLLEGRDVIGQAQTGTGQDGRLRPARWSSTRTPTTRASRRSC